MAKSLVINELGATKKWLFLPCDDTVATAFATAMLEGKFEVFVRTGEVGTDNATSYRDVTVSIKNVAGKSTYISFPAKSTKSDSDILTALAGKTFNGVKGDTVAIVKMITRTVGA